MLGPHVRASDSSIYKVLVVRSSHVASDINLFNLTSLMPPTEKVFPILRRKVSKRYSAAAKESDNDQIGESF